MRRWLASCGPLVMPVSWVMKLFTRTPAFIRL
jgi:hypothetical protein